jgi:hypothetical protein
MARMVEMARAEEACSVSTVVVEDVRALIKVVTVVDGISSENEKERRRDMLLTIYGGMKALGSSKASLASI